MTEPARPSRRRLAAWALVAAASLFATATAAAPKTTTSSTVPPGAETDLGFTSPRSTMRGFLEAARQEDWHVAARHLDLRDVPPRERDTKGAKLAKELKTVLDRTLDLNLDTLSADPSGVADDGQPEDRDVLGTINTSNGPVPLYLQRVESADGSLQWRVSYLTVAKIERLYDEFGGKPAVAGWLPPIFFSFHVFDTALWQWAGIAVLALASYLLALLLATIVIALLRMIAHRTRSRLDDALAEMTVGPIRLVLGATLFSGGIYALLLPVAVRNVFTGAAHAILAAGVTWFVIRVVAIASRRIQIRMAEEGHAVGISAVPLIRRVVNAFILLIALLVIIGSFGVNVTGIIAGLGVGGLAIALAAQKSFENLFGGLALIFDQPVHVGDFCRFGDQIGTIEDIGLRSTRVRTLNRTVVTVPNAEFSMMQLENFTRRDRIWLSTKLGVRYETSPDQLRYLLLGIKKMLLGHPKIDPDPARVRFTGFGAYSLDLDIFAYVRTTDYNEFLAVQEDVFLRIMDIVAESGTGFAFPSQTVYTAPDDGLDAERTGHAESTVGEWRAQRRLFLPTIPADEAATLTDRLAYPAEGSPDSPARRDGDAGD